jgi:hypothetical protein
MFTPFQEFWEGLFLEEKTNLVNFPADPFANKD